MKRFIGLWVILLLLSSCGDKEPLETLEGRATYYGDFFHGKVTTSGEVFNMNDMTAAHPSYPFGTKVRVINLENEKEVTVEINDRPRTNRKSRIDLSKGAAKKLGMIKDGIVEVKMEVLAWGDKNETGENK